jgi:hypothetical protein
MVALEHLKECRGIILEETPEYEEKKLEKQKK